MDSSYAKMAEYREVEPCKDENIEKLLDFAKLAFEKEKPVEQKTSTDEHDIQFIIDQYRKMLKKEKPRHEPRKIDIDVVPAIKRMAFLEVLVHNHEHAGFPLNMPPFKNEPEHFLEVCHNVLPELGDKMKLNIYKCVPNSRLVMPILTADYILGKQSVPSDRCPATISSDGVHLPINRMVNASRKAGDDALQILIEGLYFKNGVQTLSMLKRIEVWSKCQGYHISRANIAFAWPLELKDLSHNCIDDKYENLLLRPFEKSGTLDIDTRLCFKLKLYSENNENPEEGYNFDRNPNARRYRNFELLERSERIRNLCKDKYIARKNEITKTLLLQRVVYVPLCQQTFTDVRCIICKCQFKSIPALLWHIHVRYPALSVAVQWATQEKQSGVSEEVCLIKLIANGNKATHLFRKEFKEMADVTRNEPYDFDKVMLHALSNTGLYLCYNKWVLSDLVRSKDSLIICHDCKMHTKYWASYMMELCDLSVIASHPTMPFDKKIFWCLLKSFMAKSHWGGFRNGGHYQFLRLFIDSQPIVIYENLYDFKTNFSLLLNKHMIDVFGRSDLSDIEKADLETRAGVWNHNLRKDGALVIKIIWDRKAVFLKRRDPKFKLLKKLVSGEMPNTQKSRSEVFKKIISDEFSVQVTGLDKIMGRMLDSHGIEVNMPMCVFFGYRKDEQMKDSYRSYYDK